jgi:dUTP pyrophosphatase
MSEMFTSSLPLPQQVSDLHKVYMHLMIYVDEQNDTLKQTYITAATKHNQKLLEDPHFYDAGFDLFLPTDMKVSEPHRKVDFGIKCCAIINRSLVSDVPFFTPFYTYARSSISKTPLRLANNQGIIDAGYRGNLIGVFDWLPDVDKNYTISEYSRLLQICAPGLIPIYVTIVDTIDELGPSTLRGEGGFGSTGI